MSEIGFKSIVDFNSGMIEYRFSVPIQATLRPLILTDAEAVLAMAKIRGDESIWITAGLLTAQLKHIEKQEKESRDG